MYVPAPSHGGRLVFGGARLKYSISKMRLSRLPQGFLPSCPRETQGINSAVIVAPPMEAITEETLTA
jgi:hypothetical protein